MKEQADAKQLLGLLAARHGKDVFVAECKSGPTHGAAHLRLDAWAMRSSWANACATGYEIKVSRSDFQRDEKWRNYLPYCNEFYFVTTSGVADLSELPAEVGLLVASKNLKRLYCKRKAVYRDLEVPDPLYRYILMCRARIADEREGGAEYVDAATYWRRWLATKELDHELGRRVSRALRTVIATRIGEVGRENRELKDRCGKYEDVRRVLSGLGLDPDCPPSEWRMSEAVASARQVVPRSLVRDLNDLQRTITDATSSLENFMGD